MSFLDSLLPASWRGVAFGVEEYTNKLGRRVAVHEYPYKDSVWIEDLGSGAKSFQFQGFLSGPLAAIQHDAMLLAVDKPGLGTLTHPTLGIFQGVITQFASTYSKEAGGVYELDIHFTQSIEPAFPGATTDWLSKINLGALNLFSLEGTAFGTAVSVVGIAAAAVSAMPSVIGGWLSAPQTLVGDAQSIGNSIKGIDPSYGPYARGSTTPAAPGATPASLQASAGLARAAAQAACQNALTAASTGIAATVAAAVQAVPTAIRAAITEPTDQIRILLGMAAYRPAVTTTTDPFGLAVAAVQTATGSLCQIAALAELANAAAAYQFTSHDEAARLSSQIAASFAQGMLAAGSDDVLQGLRALRASVLQYLADIGAASAPLRTVTFRAPLPALVIAQRLYQDGTRADELIRNAVPWHPAFMPMQLVVPAV